MALIWIDSPSQQVSEAFSSLLLSLGHSVRHASGRGVQVIIRDLCSSGPPYRVAPAIPTLAFICTDDEETLVDLLLLGYKGYLPGYIDAKVLAAALDALQRGQLWASHHVSGMALSRAFGGKKPLTLEQVRILALVKQGLSDHEIALQLGLSDSKVKHQLHETYKKLGVSGRGSLGNGWKMLRTSV